MIRHCSLPKFKLTEILQNYSSSSASLSNGSVTLSLALVFGLALIYHTDIEFFLILPRSTHDRDTSLATLSDGLWNTMYDALLLTCLLLSPQTDKTVIGGTVTSGAEERTFWGARLDVLIFRLRSYHVLISYSAESNGPKFYKTLMFLGQAGMFLSFQARRPSATRSSTSDLTVVGRRWGTRHAGQTKTGSLFIGVLKTWGDANTCNCIHL